MATRKADTGHRQSRRFQFERLEPRKMLASFLGNIDYAVDVENKVCSAQLQLSATTAEVVTRNVFYNDSAFDGNSPLANADDDNAIATDKVALLPGETASFANYTSFVHGINGIIVDIDLDDPAGLTSNDIRLAVGSGNELSDFERLAESPEVTVRVGEGVDGSDRISIVLPNGSVVNQYLQVTIIANQTTGLANNDVFYFGNVIADTGNSTNQTFVNADDIVMVRNNLSGFFAEEVDSPYDFNRDQFVNADDIGTARNNLSGFIAVPLITAPVLGVDYFVTSASEIDSITSSLQPGDTITLQDGNWTNQQIHFEGVGTEDRPITLRAQTPGQVILNGSSSLNICGDWLVADGLNFNGGALGAGDHVVEFRGNCGSNGSRYESTNSRLTNSAITNYNPSNESTRYFWVSLYGQNNRVDHNSFVGHNHSGVTVTVWRDTSDPDYHLIDNNYFADRPEGSTTNGYETIRIGTSDESLSDSFTIVESNLFERTDGEIEIISNKSGNNIFRYNTFRESAGTLTLRHGDNNLVEGNFFLGEGKDRSGGVRVIGENQTIVNNYFEGLDGRANGAISISAAVPNSALNEYFLVRNAVIAHNTIVNVNDAGIIFDHGFGSSDRTLLAENVTIANNLISSTLDPLFRGDEGSGWTWEGNIAFGQSLGPKAGDSGITVVDPQLVQDAQGIWRLDSSSPAIDSSSGNYSGATGSVDVDGQSRVGIFDIGADEFSAAPILRAPLIVGDVGHFWSVSSGVGGDSSEECLSCLAIESSDFASVLDPNGDGDNWTAASSSDALDGFTLVAPTGSLASLSGTHDAIVTFNLDFRIGKREADAELDAFVFHLDAELTDAELDALFV
jgi:poly(beta-D-mannuronate) lyase